MIHIDSDSLALIFTFLPKTVLLQDIVPVCRYWAHFCLSSVVWGDYNWSQKNVAFIVKFATTYGPYLSSLCFNNCRYMTENVVVQCIQSCPNLTELNFAGCTALHRIRTVAGKNDESDQILSEDLFRNLTSLSVAYTSIPVTDVRNIILLCADILQVLDLRGISFKLSNLFVKTVGRNIPPSVLNLTNVHTFKIGGYNRYLSKPEMECLFTAWLPNVKSLTVSSFCHANSGSIDILYHLKRWPQLTKLEVSNVDTSLMGVQKQNSYSSEELLRLLPDTVTHLSIEVSNTLSLEGIDQFFTRKNLSIQSLTIAVSYHDDMYVPYQPRDGIIAEVLSNPPSTLREFELKLNQPPRFKKHRTVPDPAIPMGSLDPLRHPFTKFEVNPLLVTSRIWSEKIQKLVNKLSL